MLPDAMTLSPLAAIELGTEVLWIPGVISWVHVKLGGTEGGERRSVH